MKLTANISARIAVAAALCALISVPIVGKTTAEMVGVHAVRIMIDELRRARNDQGTTKCESDPSSFSMAPSSDVLVHAYDLRTLRSANPEAPPIDEELLARYKSGEARPGRIHMTGEWGGVLFDPRSESGPCSLMQIRWRAQRGVRPAFWLRQLAIISALIVLGIVVSVLIAIRPLLNRLKKLQRAAQNMGEENRYNSASDNGPDMIGELSWMLDATHERLVSQRRALKEHLQNVAHDLRTPLASLQLALEEASITEDADTKDSVLAALDDAIYMDGLTNNLHLAAKLERAIGLRDLKARADLGRTVDFVLSRFRVLGRRQNIEVTTARPDGPVHVMCDPSMAQQALSNLVQNAVKYGNAGGHVAILLERTQTRFELEVIDDGPGVPADKLERLSERHFRADEAITRDGGGAGLGLSIVARVAEHAGWKLEFSQVEPSGLRVRLSGPLVEVETKESGV